jgi:hypothetical protein
MKLCLKTAGTRGAHRRKARQVYLAMSAEDREDWRYQMAEMRLQAEMEDRECAVKADLAATDPRLPLTTRCNLFSSFSSFHIHTRLLQLLVRLQGWRAHARYRMAADTRMLVTRVAMARRLALAKEVELRRLEQELQSQRANPVPLYSKIGVRPRVLKDTVTLDKGLWGGGGVG